MELILFNKKNKTVNIALCNAFGFGGNDSSFILKKI